MRECDRGREIWENKWYKSILRKGFDANVVGANQGALEEERELLTEGCKGMQYGLAIAIPGSRSRGGTRRQRRGRGGRENMRAMRLLPTGIHRAYTA